MRPLLHALVATVCLFVGAGAQATGDVETGKLRAQTCMGCHGAPGMRNAYPGYRVPKLGGQHPSYIISALKSYQAETRSHPTMRAQAAELTEEDMENIAAYFGSLAEPNPGQIGEDNPATQCAACHGPDGNSPPDNPQGAPILAGQYPDYIVQALHEYKTGERQNPIMGGFAAGLDKQQMKTIAEFYAEQEGLAAPNIAD
jgi:cytochrome c553